MFCMIESSVTRRFLAPNQFNSKLLGVEWAFDTLERIIIVTSDSVFDLKVTWEVPTGKKSGNAGS